jgi:hypothetical protein
MGFNGFFDDNNGFLSLLILFIIIAALFNDNDIF